MLIVRIMTEWNSQDIYVEEEIVLNREGTNMIIKYYLDSVLKFKDDGLLRNEYGKDSTYPRNLVNIDQLKAILSKSINFNNCFWSVSVIGYTQVHIETETKDSDKISIASQLFQETIDGMIPFGKLSDYLNDWSSIPVDRKLLKPNLEVCLYRIIPTFFENEMQEELLPENDDLKVFLLNVSFCVLKDFAMNFFAKYSNGSNYN